MTDEKAKRDPKETRSPGEDPGKGQAGQEGEEQPGDARIETRDGSR